MLYRQVYDILIYSWTCTLNEKRVPETSPTNNCELVKIFFKISLWHWVQYALGEIPTSHIKLAGTSMIEPHASRTELQSHLHCVGLSVCLQPYAVNFKWAHLKVSESLNVLICSVGNGYCQSAVSTTWSKNNWSWSAHGNLLLVCPAT